jgi:hypothetical protein
MIKRKPLEFPPEVARAFMEEMRAYHAEENVIKRMGSRLEPVGGSSSTFSGKLRISDVVDMFEQMRDYT